jgi:exopolysaccharide production protein ExoZ
MPFGWIGVQVFFVISGVVIANSAATASPLQFLRGRVLRLYPAAWIAALINIAILLMVPRSHYQALGISVIPHLGAFARSLTLFGDYFLASSYWTLPIELTFYAIVFAALCTGGAERFRLIARTLVTVSMSYLLLLFLVTLHVLDAPWLNLGYGLKNALLVRHGSYFAIGIYFWMITNRRDIHRADYLFFAAALCASILEIYCRASELVGVFAAGSSVPSGAEVLSIASIAAFFCFAATIFMSLRYADKWIPSKKAKGILRTLGLMTYPYYLTHEVIGGAILHHAKLLGLSHPAGIFLALMSVGFVSYVIALHAEPIARQLISRSINWATNTAWKAKQV